MSKIKSFVTTPLGIVTVAILGGFVALAIASRVSAVGKLVSGNKASS